MIWRSALDVVSGANARKSSSSSTTSSSSLALPAALVVSLLDGTTSSASSSSSSSLSTSDQAMRCGWRIVSLVVVDAVRVRDAQRDEIVRLLDIAWREWLWPLLDAIAASTTTSSSTTTTTTTTTTTPSSARKRRRDVVKLDERAAHVAAAIAECAASIARARCCEIKFFLSCFCHIYVYCFILSLSLSLSLDLTANAVNRFNVRRRCATIACLLSFVFHS